MLSIRPTICGRLPRMAKRKKKSRRGGIREGAGRKSMFMGTKVKVTVKLTERARDLAETVREQLSIEDGRVWSFGNAVERLIREATDTPRDD